jgi:predicted enzyme related to lactoylglutathione lyase
MRVGVVIDSQDPQVLAAFWEQALRYRRAGELAGYVVLAPSADDAGPGRPVLVLQRVDEPRTGKNRLHLDLHSDDVPAEVTRLTALGAQPSGGPVTELLASAGIWWQVMSDPQGNEFCLVAESGQPESGQPESGQPESGQPESAPTLW